MNAVSFFTGAGGLDIGMSMAGFDVRLGVELESKYCQSAALNHPAWNVKCGDIMLYNKQKVYEDAGLKNNESIDLVFGGSPCQSFSTAGLRQAFEDPRGQAMLKYAELIEELQPKVFLLENVRGLLSVALKHRRLEQRGKGFEPLTEEELPGSALKYLLTKFSSYDVQYRLINAANYGVPQKRERVFLIGTRKDLGLSFVYPKETHSKYGDRGKNKWVPISSVFERLKELQSHTFVTYSEERLKYMKMIPKGGGNWRNLPKDIAKEAMGGAYKSGGGKVGFFRRINIDEPSPTLLTTPHQKSTNLGHPFEDRPLSIEEYLEIQGFPQDYKLAGTLTEQYTQVGNAVPIQLAFRMGEAIKQILD